MVVDRVGHRVLRIPLTVAVIVDYQIPRQPHQPIGKIALLRVVLVERPVDSDKDFLRQVLGRFGARREPVGEVEDPPRKRGNNLLPRHAVAAASPPHEVSTIQLHRRLQSFQAGSLQISKALNQKRQRVNSRLVTRVLRYQKIKSSNKVAPA